MLEALEAVLEHVNELAEAWRRGTLHELDQQGGTRSNRNVDVRVAVIAAIAAARKENG